MFSIASAQLTSGSRDRGFEWVQVDHDQVDRQETLALEGGKVVGFVASREDSAVDLGVQSLDPAAEDLGLTGVVGDFGHFETGRDERGPAASAGQELGAATRRVPAPARSIPACRRR